MAPSKHTSDLNDNTESSYRYFKHYSFREILNCHTILTYQNKQPSSLELGFLSTFDRKLLIIFEKIDSKSCIYHGIPLFIFDIFAGGY